MTAKTHSLVIPADYVQLEDGSFSLPNNNEFLLMIDGAQCTDPHLGALHYNRGLIRFLKQKEFNKNEESRYQRIFRKYANNHRVRKVLHVAKTVKNNHVVSEGYQNPTKINSFNSFTPFESVLFFHIPVDYR